MTMTFTIIMTGLSPPSLGQFASRTAQNAGLVDQVDQVDLHYILEVSTVSYTALLRAHAGMLLRQPI